MSKQEEGNFRETNTDSVDIVEGVQFEQHKWFFTAIRDPPPLDLLLVEALRSVLNNVNPSKPSSASFISGTKFVSTNAITS